MLGIAKTNVDIGIIEQLKEFDNHELVSWASDTDSGLKSVIAVHRANPTVPSFGATRFWHYASDIDGVKDALRLSRLMSYKAALAGLECGGAKGVILADRDALAFPTSERQKILRAYAARVNLLGNRFITGTDVGVSQEDLKVMQEVSGQIVGFNDNSTESTVAGVFESVKIALAETFGSDDFAGHSFAIQGVGKVGSGLLSRIYELVGAAGQIFIADVNPTAIETAVREHPRVVVVAPDDIDKLEVDVFSPCALSGAINRGNVDGLSVKIVVGCANNQLESETVGKILHERNILYAPDYVVNAGGLIAVFDEYTHPVYDRGRVEKAVGHIPKTVQKIFSESREEKLPPSLVANRMAERIFNSYNHAV